EPKPAVDLLGRDVMLGESPGPELKRFGRSNPPEDAVDHPVAGSARGDPRILEEGDVRAGIPLLVRVEEVVDGRVVLVDRLLHHPQAENARIEVDVRLRLSGDRGDVMYPLQAHICPP